MVSISSFNSLPANRQPISFREAHDLSQEGQLVRDLFVSMDDVKGLDKDPRKGFVDLQDPQKFYDKAEMARDDKGEITSLTLSNNYGMHPSRTWTYDQNGEPTSLTINNPTYAKKDQTVYRFEFGPDKESSIEHVYERV